MWRRSFSNGLVLVAAVALGQTVTLPGNFDSMMGQFQQQLKAGPVSGAQLQSNFAALSGQLQQNQWTPQQQAAASQQVSSYLGSVRPYAGNDLSLGTSMAGIYRQMGGMQMGSNPRGAWMNYRSSYLLLNGLYGMYPGNQQLTQEMQQVRHSAEVIEAKMPELPRADWGALSGENQKEFDELMSRYISVSAQVSSAEVMAETMRRNFAQQGLAVRPEVVSGMTRMKLKMEDAKRLIEQKKYGQARERLDSADGEAKKVLTAFGG